MDAVTTVLLLIIFLGSLKIYLKISSIFKERVVEQSTALADFNASGRYTGRLSIVIPFYNEEPHLEACTNSLSEAIKDYEGDFEIIFVDDESRDDSLNILKKWIASSPYKNSIKVISSGRSDVNNEYKNWVGKSLPCHVGYKHSIGDSLLFLDADVELEQGSIHDIVAQASVDSVDFMSVIPKAKCTKLYAWAFYPICLICQIIAFDFIRKNPDNSFPSASGQVMLFRREAYEKIGGFKALSGNVAQDVRAAKLVKSKSLKQKHILGYNLAALDSEESFYHLINSSSKSIMVAVENDIFKVLVFPIIMVLVTSLPIYVFLNGLFGKTFLDQSFLSLMTVFDQVGIFLASMTVLIHGITLYRFQLMLKKGSCLVAFYPLGSMVFFLVSLHALFTFYSGSQKYWKWKGRQIFPTEE